MTKALTAGLKARGTLIFYLGEFSMSNMDYNFTQWLIDQLANNYPETLKHILVVDSPWIFNLCWKLIKGWLDPRTADKIAFINKDQFGTYIDKANLPVEFGGDSFVYKYEGITD